LFERDLSSQERALLAKQQALIAQKQDLITDEQRYLNKLILALTVVALGGAIAEVVVLSPLNDMFPENAQFFYQSQLFLTLIASGVLTVVILIMYTRTLKMRNPYRVKQIFTKSKRNT
jgi:CBS domain containing-hemolysin-like protein